MQPKSKIVSIFSIIYFSFVIIGLIIHFIYLSPAKRKTVITKLNEFDGFPDEGNAIVKFDKLAMNTLLTSASMILGLPEIRKILKSSPKKDMKINKILLNSIKSNKRTCFTKDKFQRIEEILFPKADYIYNTDYFPYNFTNIFFKLANASFITEKKSKIQSYDKTNPFYFKMEILLEKGNTSETRILIIEEIGDNLLIDLNSYELTLDVLLRHNFLFNKVKSDENVSSQTLIDFPLFVFTYMNSSNIQTLIDHFHKTNEFDYFTKLQGSNYKLIGVILQNSATDEAILYMKLDKKIYKIQKNVILKAQLNEIFQKRNDHKCEYTSLFKKTG